MVKKCYLYEDLIDLNFVTTSAMCRFISSTLNGSVAIGSRCVAIKAELRVLDFTLRPLLLKPFRLSVRACFYIFRLTILHVTLYGI
jgi:hypothetical protein